MYSYERSALTQKEQTRLKVLNSVLEDQLPVCKALEVMGVSERHTRRILRAYGKKGVRAVSHGDHGLLKAIANEARPDWDKVMLGYPVNQAVN